MRRNDRNDTCIEHKEKAPVTQPGLGVHDAICLTPTALVRAQVDIPAETLGAVPALARVAADDTRGRERSCETLG